MRTRQRKARKGSCHSSLFVTDARSGHFAPISGIIVHSFDLQSLFQSFRSFEKRFTLCSSSKKKYGTDRQKFPGSLNLRSPFGRKTFLRQNKVNPEDDNPQPTLPATIKESHAPVTMVPSLPAHNLRTDGPQRQNEKLSNMSDFNVFAPVGVYSARGNSQFRGFGRQLRHSRNYCSKPLCRKLYSPPRAIIR